MAKKSVDIVFTTALRTAIGRYKGMWSKYQAHDLGEAVIKNILIKSKVEPKFIDEVIMGQVLTGDTGQNPARQAAIRAGIPKEKTGYVINQVCGSGLRSIVAGYQSILLGDAKMVIAGGQESMTNSKEEMMLKDGLIDAYNNYHMGITAENVAEKWNILRKDQDVFAASSQSKAQEAIKNKKFMEEIIDKLTEDEHPRKEVTIENLSKLKPAFKENGTVTAGNSSGINDGAAAVLLMSRDESDRRGLTPLAKIVSWATCGVDPALMGSGPIPASKKALEKAGWNINDLDLIESNEAFAAQSIAVIRELKIPIEKVNVNGGAIALGHPIGASGARIVVTLIHEMIRRNSKKGLATLCIGGGMGIAMCIEKD
ncbi:MAG: acetyl-CoA acetyltransferase [Candidatus Pelagibacterales bacterium]|nr:MAG: acetyl-CoA acetyltransferase [Pelagibacterales bacterium]